MGRTSEGAGGGRTEVELRLIRRSLEDEAFRQLLLRDPKGAIEQELGASLPEGIQVRVVKETPDTIFLVLPSTSPVGQTGKISDRALFLLRQSTDDNSPVTPRPMHERSQVLPSGSPTAGKR